MIPGPKATLFLLTGLTPTLSSCSDLSAIGSISSRLAAASESWDAVAVEFVNSCAREASMNPMLNDCDLEKKASDGLAGVDAVLRNYFSALGDAADESNFSIQPGLDAATKSAENIPGINKGQVTAVAGLFSLLVKVGMEAAREATLRELIDQGAPPAQTVVQGLEGLVIPRLDRQLAAERMQLTGQFGRLIATQKDRTGPNPAALCQGATASGFSGTGFLLVIEYCRRLAILEVRSKALADYKASLTAADATLAELQSARTRLGAKDLARKLSQLGGDLDAKVAQVRKAFG